MKRWLLFCAVMLVRSWSRAYTTGLHPEVRRRRRSEIESDIWESLHDPERTDATAMQIFLRFARGMPADLLWRLDHILTGEQLMWRKLVLLCLAATTLTVMVWSVSPRVEPLALPNRPPKPIPNFVQKRRGPPPPPRPGPTWEEFVAKVNGRVANSPSGDTTDRR